MKEGFDIHIKDNFLDDKLFKLIYDKIPFYTYRYNFTQHAIKDSKLISKENKNEHLFYGADAEKHTADHIRKKCSKLYNKKFKERFCSYTMVARTTPMVHKDLDDYTSHQILLYIRGDESLHRGTGFYVKNKNTKDTYELNTHIGFKENRAIFWESSSYHSPLMWDDKNQSKRFSILAQYKEI